MSYCTSAKVCNEEPVSALYDRYRFFRKHAGYIVVGLSAVYAMRLARAEQAAERLGLVVWWENEEDPWDGESPAPEYLMRAACSWKKDMTKYRHPHVLASLGMIGFSEWNDPSRRVVEAELFHEALSGGGMP
jgi:hypothetical protein